MPEHLVLPWLQTEAHTPVQIISRSLPNVPVFDAFAYLSYLAGSTHRLRFGTHVYNIGLRHPSVAELSRRSTSCPAARRSSVSERAGSTREWEAASLEAGASTKPSRFVNA